MFILQLNDMRAAQVENLTPVFRSESEAALKNLIAMESVPRYQDGQWGKSFKQGGPLEWYNPAFENSGIVNVGTEEDWRENGARAFHNEVLTITVQP